MIRAGLLTLLLASLGVGSLVVLPIERVEVVGHRQLSPTQVQQITGLEPGAPWLWAWPYRLKPLLDNPWVRSATLERPAPGQIRIVLQERTSIANLLLGKTRMGLSADGVLLPNPPAQTPVIEGRGDVPIDDLLLLVQAFPNAKHIRYDVGGYQILADGLNVWGKNVKELQDWAKLSRIGKSDASAVLAHPAAWSNGRIYVYSWGVSARR
ncbi:FtsQ-type POTRA domain-containing protein [Meiothermus ruber]|uniref:FtsQ-type POTRA domain-containing protein n=1 Tax=Meiothermus TaxID=65551 RepID=UPI00055D6912|nr:FtsQ-type POTRA domain-containing protein [Meiothermus ruber]